MVDIIVPIYNAYKAVDECIASIIKHTDLNKNRLILINDKSTDETILGLLNSYKEKNPELNIVVLDNEVNLGFVGTVNKGMKYSKHDVILLNSDTEVSDFWVEEMEKCAYSQEDVATVTALSNNATLASVPNGLQPNQLPDSMTFDEYAHIVHTRSLHRYPQIPTAHGFCMYIRRNVLDIVGYFDQEAFVQVVYGTNMEKKMISHIVAWIMVINIYYVIVLLYIIKKANLLMRKKSS